MWLGTLMSFLLVAMFRSERHLLQPESPTIVNRVREKVLRQRFIKTAGSVFPKNTDIYPLSSDLALLSARRVPSLDPNIACTTFSVPYTPVYRASCI